MKLWSLREGHSKPLSPVALRTRDDVRVWAAARMMPASDYRTAEIGSYHGRPMRLWKAVLRYHPNARIVRVNVQPDKGESATQDLK